MQLPFWAPALAGGVIVLLWLAGYFRAMAPRKGTAEWITLAAPDRFSAPGLQRWQKGSWLVPPLALLAGMGSYLWQLPAISALQPLEAAICALGTAAFAAALQCLYGVPLAALCGGVLYAFLGAGGALLPEFLLLSVLALCAPRALRRLLFFAAAFALCALAGVTPGMLGAAAAVFVCAIVCAVLRDGFGPAALGELAGILLLFFAAWLLGAYLTAPVRPESALALWRQMRAPLYLRAAVWTLHPLLAALLALPALLHLALRRKQSAWLLGCLLALGCLALLLDGNEALALAGGLLALGGTFAGAQARGQSWQIVLTTLGLLGCYLCFILLI